MVKKQNSLFHEGERSSKGRRGDRVGGATGYKAVLDVTGRAASYVALFSLCFAAQSTHRADRTGGEGGRRVIKPWNFRRVGHTYSCSK